MKRNVGNKILEDAITVFISYRCHSKIIQSWWLNTTILYNSSGGQSPIRLTGLKSSIGRTTLSLEIRKEHVPCLFPLLVLLVLLDMWLHHSKLCLHSHIAFSSSLVWHLSLSHFIITLVLLYFYWIIVNFFITHLVVFGPMWIIWIIFPSQIP